MFDNYIQTSDITIMDVIKDFAETNGFKLPIKGGLALSYLYNTLEPSSRNTIDIDYHFMKESDWKKFKDNAVVNATKNSKLGVSYKIIKEKNNTNGNSLTIEFNSSNLDGKFKVDMNYGDYCKIINLNNVVLYSPEMIIADKLSVLCSTTIQRRCKDLYDIYLIINHEKFSMQALADEIKKKLSSRNVILGKLSLLNPSILSNLKYAYRKIKLIDMPEFEEICKIDLKFVLPVLSNMGNKIDNICWDNTKRNWNTDKPYNLAIKKDLYGIISRETASGMLGLSTFPPHPVLVSNNEIQLDMGIVKFIRQNYDEKYLIKLRDNLFITNKERTIIDMLEDGEYRILMESIETYIDENDNIDKLMKVAKELNKEDILDKVLIEYKQMEM